MSSSLYLPTNMVAQILIRRPTKSLLQYTSVCKSWYSLITNPNFISSHLNHHQTLTTHNPNLPLFVAEGDDQHSIWRDGEDISDRTWLGCPWEKDIRQSIELEPVPVGVFDSDFIAVGFGFDSVENDYKVVAITYYDHLSHEIKPPPIPYAHVYSLSSGAWRNIGFPDYDSDVDWSWDSISNVSVSHAFVNGVIYWIKSTGAVFVDVESDEEFLGDLGTSVLTFDLNKEVFGELDLPCGIYDIDHPNLSIGIIEDSLAVFHCEDEYCSVFVREDDGGEEYWATILNIRLAGPCSRVLCLRNVCEMLVILEPGSWLLLTPMQINYPITIILISQNRLGMLFLAWRA